MNRDERKRWEKSMILLPDIVRAFMEVMERMSVDDLRRTTNLTWERCEQIKNLYNEARSLRYDAV